MIEQAKIEESLNEFKGHLSTLPAVDVVRCHILSGPSLLLDEPGYLSFRCKIADHLAVHPNEVVMVGSGKLGFSIAPTKLYRHFCDESDIDVAIVSSALFERVWKSVYEYWRQGGYWEGSADFSEYLFRGWLRPDKLPAAHRLEYCKDWWEFFRQLTASGEYGAYSIRAGLYRSWFFLEDYHQKNIEACQSRLGDSQ